VVFPIFDWINSRKSLFDWNLYSRRASYSDCCFLSYGISSCGM